MKQQRCAREILHFAGGVPRELDAATMLEAVLPNCPSLHLETHLRGQMDVFMEVKALTRAVADH